MPGFVYLIAPGFNEDLDKIDLTINLTRITFPFLIFVSLASFFSAILNSHNNFGAGGGARGDGGGGEPADLPAAEAAGGARGGHRRRAEPWPESRSEAVPIAKGLRGGR